MDIIDFANRKGQRIGILGGNDWGVEKRCRADWGGLRIAEGEPMVCFVGLTAVA